jgi:2-amino-4-hydroxy-6-hydroxymethyldihydropteridine diphosphokinase
MSRAETVTAYVGLGANLAEPREQVLDALAELDEIPETRVTGRSSLYRSAPIGNAGQPDFVNAVARLETRLAADRLLAELLAIEQRHGRQRSVRNAARTLDLDLLLYGEARIDSAALSVPHPRMHERAFVLRPLLELAPGARIPGRGPVSALLPGCAGQAVERIR